MAKETRTIVGYVLLGIGIFLILKGLYGVYAVFTGAALPPSLFTIADVVLSLSGGSGSLRLLEGAQATKMADMATWYILMFFFVTAGSKVAGIGAQLVRQIQVTVKSQGEAL